MRSIYKKEQIDTKLMLGSLCQVCMDDRELIAVIDAVISGFNQVKPVWANRNLLFCGFFTTL